MTTAPTPHYQVVALRGNNSVAGVVRTFPSYPVALGYLLHNLPRRPNLDIVDDNGRPVAWEFTPPLVAA